MTGFILKKIFILIPTLFFISLITFVLIKIAPGDPVLTSFKDESGHAVLKKIPKDFYAERRRELGLDLPVFYISFGSSVVSDTISKITYPSHRYFLKKTAKYFGSWDASIALYNVLTNLENHLQQNLHNRHSLKRFTQFVSEIYRWENAKTFNQRIQNIITESEKPGIPLAIKKQAQQLHNVLNSNKNNKNAFYRFIPHLSWHGKFNQYHAWMFGNNRWPEKILWGRNIQKGIFSGDFGVSYQNEKPVSSIVKETLPVTLTLALASFLLFNIGGIGLGFALTFSNKPSVKKGIKLLLGILYSTPSYWMALLGIIFLCNPDYFNWFPSSFTSLDTTSNNGFWYHTTTYFYFLVLPVICIVLGNIPFVGFQVHSETLNVMQAGFLITAKSKGLNKQDIFNKHVLRNVLLPIITFSSKSILLAVTGSLTIEIIFSIRGIGTVIYEGLQAGDHPVIFSTTLIICTAAIIIFILADLLYALADPRIKFGKNF